MFCPDCGKESEKDSVFCTACGKLLNLDTSEPLDAPAMQISAEVPAAVPVGDSGQSSKLTVPDETPASPISVQYYSVPAEAVIQQPSASRKPPKKGGFKWWTAVIVILCVLAVAGTAVGIIILNNADSTPTSADDSSTAEEVSSTVSTSDTSPSDTSSDTSSGDSPAKLTEDMLLGDWKFRTSFNEAPLSSDDEDISMSGFETDAAFECIMRFNDDKTVQILCEKDAFQAAYDEFVSDYITYLRNGGFYDMMYERDGYTKEQVDEAMALLGMTVELFIDNFEEQTANEDIFADKTITADGHVLMTDTEVQTRYALEEGRLTFVRDDDITKETYFDFEYKDGTMTVTEGDYAEGIMVGKTLTKNS